MEILLDEENVQNEMDCVLSLTYCISYVSSVLLAHYAMGQNKTEQIEQSKTEQKRSQQKFAPWEFANGVYTSNERRVFGAGRREDF